MKGATAGRRFTDRYRHRRRKGRAWRRPLALIAGPLLIVLGTVLILTPGPGVPVALLGAGLLASESLRVARALDALELRLRAIVRRHRGV